MIENQSRPLPPMFARATGNGDECGFCQYRAQRRTIKRLLPGGIQVCAVCDA